MCQMIKEFFCMISLGYSDEKKDANNFYDENKVHYDRY